MKKRMITLVAATSLLATAGIASADGTFTMYGSSAQAKFWTAQVGTWLTNAMNCPAAGVSALSTSAADGTSVFPAGTTHYKITATGCTNADAQAIAGIGSTKVLTVLYTANDSVTGVQSVGGSVSPNPDGCTGGLNYRVMYPGTGGTNGNASCQPVNMGIADVAGSSITQKSTGQKIGPLDTTATVFAPDFSVHAPDTSNITPIDENFTLATPFAFWVNKGVTATQCTSGLVGNYCGTPTLGGTSAAEYMAANAQCDTKYFATGPGTGDGRCGSSTGGATPTAPAATTITNIDRLQASLIFSGQVPDWSYLGSYFTAQPVTVCLRHAGSGTHATLVNAVMNAGGSNWGTNVLQLQDGKTGHEPIVWFNNGSGDEMNCVNGDSKPNAANFNTVNQATGGLMGAIGYSDADASAGTYTTEVRYNGFFPTRSAMRNGVYDFYAVAYYYVNNAATSAVTTFAQDMVDWAGVPSNMVASKANYWATVAEMGYIKGSDQAYPGYVGASTVVLP